MTLLRLLFENVIQTIQQDRSELHVVPNSERSQNPAYAIAVSELNATKPPTLRVAVNDLHGADPQKNRSRQQTNSLQHAVLRHHDETSL